jgi:putative transposase
VLRRPPKSAQYCSIDYQAELKANGLLNSMSGRGNCFNNAMVETFFKTLKSELVWRTAFETRNDAAKAIGRYIDGFYNPVRRHSALDFISPVQFERMTDAWPNASPLKRGKSSPARQDRRGEADAPATLIGAALAQSDPLHLDRPNAALHHALRAMTMPDQAVTPVWQLHPLHRGQERLGFCFDGLRQKTARAIAQNHRQRIVDRVGLTEGNNSAIAHRGVSLLREVQAGFHCTTHLDTPPFSRRHHPGSAIAPSRRTPASSFRLRPTGTFSLQRAGTRAAAPPDVALI